MQYFVVGSLFVIIIAVAGWLIFFYNIMSHKKASVDDSWRLLNIQFRRRSDLIKEYVEIISKCNNPEAGTLKELMASGKSYLNAENLYDVMNSSREISKRLEGLMTGDSCFAKDDNSGADQKLHELLELEVKIEKYRITYNDKAHDYNTFLSEFPNKVAGKILGVEEYPYFLI